MEYAKNCARCKFFFGGKDNGVCRRFPPNIFDPIAGVSRYPEVNRWTPHCGEFIVDGEKTQIVKDICPQTCMHYKNGRCYKESGVCDVYRDAINQKIKADKQ